MKKTEFDRTFYLKALIKRKHNGLVKIVLQHLPNDGKWSYVFIDEIQFCRKVLLPGRDSNVTS